MSGRVKERRRGEGEELRREDEGRSRGDNARQKIRPRILPLPLSVHTCVRAGVAEVSHIPSRPDI